MIYLILGGGLGNQMFQYAFGRFLSLKTGQEIVFNTALYDNGINKDRAFSLGYFSIPNIVIGGGKENAVQYNYFKQRTHISRILKKILPNVIFRKIFNSKGFFFSAQGPYKYFPPTIYTGSGDIYVHGGFQSQKYFEEVKDIVRKDFHFSFKMNDKNRDVYNAICSSNAVCLHIRRGDYLSAEYKDQLAVCGKKYYESGIAYMRKKIDRPVFFIFSNTHDDLEWIKQNYDIPKESFFVDLCNPDYMELRLMSACKHFVMSNSSFSWWAQFLSNNKNKIVIAPSIWDKRKDCDSEDIYLPQWIKINENGEII